MTRTGKVLSCSGYKRLNSKEYPRNMKFLICGKGGSGKSTVAALLAANMEKRGRSVFLVDADESNIGLYRMLGLEFPLPLMEYLVGKKGFREKTKAAGAGFGAQPPVFPENLRAKDLPGECLAVSGRLRVLSLGKIHHFGEGCACPMGNLFRLLFSSLSIDTQDLVIVDTAAGVEHFGRSLDGFCDHVLCVADPSYESLMMIRKVDALAREAGLGVSVVLNRVTPEIESEIVAALEGLKIIGKLPDSRSVFLNNLKGRALDPDMAEIMPICDTIEKLC